MEWVAEQQKCGVCGNVHTYYFAENTDPLEDYDPNHSLCTECGGLNEYLGVQGSDNYTVVSHRQLSDMAIVALARLFE